MGFAANALRPLRRKVGGFGCLFRESDLITIIIVIHTPPTIEISNTTAKNLMSSLQQDGVCGVGVIVRVLGGERERITIFCQVSALIPTSKTKQSASSLPVVGYVLMTCH